ncbi:uncharacterized protein BX663DRAFT_533788 [Cokeromyces recurvatus]|uniref:uncharacterized protein n=1 Tax=Cokeromyces recurvatus TaxID=90255 RepID=UPI0022210F0A|nr:uncharacterized protein BX663DRAFT_533788 [Cokeromyces recurvatus]KAI7897520.1 hypothetical protein BX663DRAFT_533788 [Cokeromyces recurvatus]
MHIIDLQQKKSVVAFDEIVSEEDNLVPIKKTDTSTSSIESSVSSSDDQVTSSNSTNYTLTKRIAAIGKADYRHQENPHLIIFVSTTGINVCLSGCNIKLFSKDFNQNTEVKILKGEIVTSNNSVCLCLLSSNGKLSFYSLPTLETMLEMNLPSNCQLNRLQEASISSDGRIIFWTGAYELEQYSFIPKPDLKIGESVFLFDPQRAIPPHPSNLLQKQQQRNKKSWLDTITNSFQKEPLTLNELDLLMGRVPAEDPNEIRRQKVEAYKATIEQQQQNGSSIGSNKGLGSVFSQLGEKMNERGEKLDQLDKKFQDMNTASGDFLKAIKDYNERQARKKWWEF